MNTFAPIVYKASITKKAVEAHKCNDSEDECFSKKNKKQVKSSKIGKDIAHYLHKQDIKGGKDEVYGKIEQLKHKGGGAYVDYPHFLQRDPTVYIN